MPAYESAGFDPPAPVARAGVVGNARTIMGVPMLLDTGADVSVVPRDVADELGVRVRQSRIRLLTFSGSESDAKVADLAVELGTYRFRGTFVVSGASYGLLGRNILNLLVATLDGPQLMWSV